MGAVQTNHSHSNDQANLVSPQTRRPTATSQDHSAICSHTPPATMSSMSVQILRSFISHASEYTSRRPALSFNAPGPATRKSVLSQTAPCLSQCESESPSVYQDTLDYISRLTSDLTGTSATERSYTSTEETENVHKMHEQESKGNDEEYSASVLDAPLENALHYALCSANIMGWLTTDEHTTVLGNDSKDLPPNGLDEATWAAIMDTLRESDPDTGKALVDKVCRVELLQIQRRHEEGSKRHRSVLVKRKTGNSGKIAVAVGIPCAIVVLGVGCLVFATSQRRRQHETREAQSADVELQTRPGEVSS